MTARKKWWVGGIIAASLWCAGSVAVEATEIGAKTGAGESKPLKQVSFVVENGNYVARVGDKTLVVTNPDYPENPRTWDSALTVKSSRKGRACSTAEYLIQSVHAPDDGAILVVLRYTGSTSHVEFVDPDTCKEKYPRIDAYSEEIQIGYRQIAVFPGCECEDDKRERCHCDAARVYAVGDNYRPALDDPESEELTKRVVGVGFRGSAKIRFPKTANAAVLPK